MEKEMILSCKESLNYFQRYREWKYSVEGHHYQKGLFMLK